MTPTAEKRSPIGRAASLPPWGAKLLILGACAAAVAALYASGVGCPFHHFLGVRCPGCGLTRAVLAACRLDIRGALAAHPMVWALPVLLAYFWKDGRVFRCKAANVLVLGGIAAGFLLVWALRLSGALA